MEVHRGESLSDPSPKVQWRCNASVLDPGNPSIEGPKSKVRVANIEVHQMSVYTLQKQHAGLSQADGNVAPPKKYYSSYKDVVVIHLLFRCLLPVADTANLEESLTSWPQSTDFVSRALLYAACPRYRWRRE